MPAFLLEIGLEEIPASMIPAAQTDLTQRIGKLLTRERLAGDNLKLTGYSTPRRLAVLADGLLPKQADIVEQVIGPSVAVAYKNGAPTPAAIAFAKKSGVEVAALKTIQNAKGEYVAATVRRLGRSAAKVLTEMSPAEIAGISWPKNMYWRAGKPERFVRPVRWLLALLDEEVLPLQLAGVTADGVSFGHRVLHGDAPVVIRKPQEYAETMAGAYVQVDPEARKHCIRKALDAAARTIPGARWRPDEELVDVVTNLTESPSVILGSFDPLGLPKEVLITVMRDHQKYFALEDADGKLLPNFLAVLNIKVDFAGADIIRHGNERVLRARFNDAQFFWDVDQKILLVDRVEMLKHVTFHKDLGSYWHKTERNEDLAKRITELPLAESINDEANFLQRWWQDEPIVSRAAMLAKADLTTEMVKEFPELQGIIGGLYAAEQGETSDVVCAISDQYKPIAVGDRIPQTRNACIVALADKLSTVVDMFTVGLQPSGSKDPFALRRAGNGIVRIVFENSDIGRTTHLWRLCQAAFRGNNKADKDEGIQVDIFNFLLDRIENYFQENYDASVQVARAVRKSGVAGKYNAPTDSVGYGYVAGFAKTLNGQRGSPDVRAVAALLKRISNILRQAREKRMLYQGYETESSLNEPIEKELAKQVTVVNDAIQKNYREGKYSEVIAAIADLQQPLNAFFDSVMVMVEDEKLRNNRLALLARTESVVRWAADFSELASIQQSA